MAFCPDGEHVPHAAMNAVKMYVEVTALAVEAAGVAVIVLGAGIVVVQALTRIHRVGTREAYAGLRVGLARSILLGLEFLVAGDIIRTVVVAPTIENVGLLGLVVLIRTFLSFTLELEVTGRFPWQRASERRQLDGGRTV